MFGQIFHLASHLQYSVSLLQLDRWKGSLVLGTQPHDKKSRRDLARLFNIAQNFSPSLPTMQMREQEFDAYDELITGGRDNARRSWADGSGGRKEST